MKFLNVRFLSFVFMMLMSGLSFAQPGNGDCDCSGEEPLVCAIDENGDVIVLPDCLAACFEYEITTCDSLGGDFECFECLENGDFEPVCAVDSNGVETFLPNACFAECLGMEIVDCGDGGGDNDCDCDLDPEEAPICVLTDAELGIVCPFPNLCFAECAGYSEADVVDCDSLGGGFECFECLENGDFEPVCALDSSGVVTFLPNACFAECLGLEIVECDSTDCICPEYYEPVCVVDPATNDTLTFDNSCFAECEGYTDWFYCDGNGDCECPEDIYDPVCVITADGDTIEYVNPCEARCAGEYEWFYCGENGCEDQCPDVYDPVCVTVDTAGTSIEFGNACLAECAGYFDYVSCDGCQCPEIYDPVCAVDPVTNDTLTFDNSCFAECEGYTDWFICDGNGGGQDCEDACPDVQDPVCVTIDATGEVLEFGNACLAECAGYFDYESCDDGSGLGANFEPFENRLSKVTANNLTRDQINLTITSVTEMDTKLQVLSYQGRQLIQRDIHLSPGQNGLILNMTGQTPGMYFVNIADIKSNHVIKVLLLD